MFDTVSHLTQQHNEVGCTNLSANDFLLYFNERVEDIRLRIPQSFTSEEVFSVSLTISAKLEFSLFESITLTALAKAVMAARPQHAHLPI